jgi:hypothetical protein
MRLRTILAVLAIGAFVPAAPAAAQAPAVWLGAWTLNVEKSTYDPGPAPYARATCTIEPWGDGVRMVYDMVRVRGGVTHLEWTGRFDGMDYPVQGVDEVLTNGYRQIDERTFEAVVKVDGQTTATSRVVFSPDGRTMTTETVGANPQAQRLRWVTVYEKR